MQHAAEAYAMALELDREAYPCAANTTSLRTRQAGADFSGKQHPPGEQVTIAGFAAFRWPGGHVVCLKRCRNIWGYFDPATQG
jgi:hypothetical protein